MLVNIDDLIDALESRDGEPGWFLDLSTGEVVGLFGDLVDDDENDALREALEEQPDRFVPIEPLVSHEAFRIMEAFVEALPDKEPAKRLSMALGQRPPFRRFKDELLAWPRLREQWFRFHHDRMREHAKKWLSSNGISATLIDGPASSPEA